MKQCSKCLEYKPDNLFHGRESGYLRSRCRKCTNEDNLERYHTRSSTKEAHRKASYRYILKSYGLTGESYNELLKAQDGKCAICKREPSYRFNVDHCHKTGQVRSLLCSNCNTALGHSKEDVKILKSLIEYLEFHNERLGI